MRFDWPGNVRELSNEMERAVALTRNDETVGAEQLSQKLRSVTAPADTRAAASAAGAPLDPETPLEPIRQARAAFETRYISEALRRHGNNVSQTARALGISRVMLQKKMKAFGLR
jgi:transcriptional regulator with PAS, ATPase and Fis domain